MRCVMMGTGGFAVPTYEALLSSRHEVVATATRPPRRGRGRQPPKNPIQIAAEHHGLAAFDPDAINDARSIDWLHGCQADVLVVCDYGQILSGETLSAASRGGINLHGSLLPAYRGAAPVQWAIYDGQPETGVSVIHMTPRLDGGPILVQRATPIQADETAEQLEQRLATIGADAVLEALDLLERWDGIQPLGTHQSDKRATRAPRLKKEDGKIDWRRTARQITNQIRAFKPWPGTFTFFRRADGSRQRLIVDEAVVAGAADPDLTHAQITAPGCVMADRDSLLVATGDGVLKLLAVQPEGKKRISGSEFVRGYPACLGMQLG